MYKDFFKRFIDIALSFIGIVVLAIPMFIVAIIIKKLAFGDPVQGFPTIMCAIFFIGGLQLFCTGILGQYLSKTYLETKNRPKYIMRENEKIYRERLEKQKNKD